MTQTPLLAWMALLPFAAALLLGLSVLLDRNGKLPERYYSVFGTFAPLAGFLMALELLFGLLGGVESYGYRLFTWLEVGSFSVSAAFLGDRLSIFMALFVTGIGWLIHLYATGYMKGEEGYGRFFAYFNLFVGSMLLLVLADNPVLMFVGWEGVGLCSYLLIGFYFKTPANVVAGNKAFIANRVGDFGFLIGLALLFWGLEGGGFTFHAIESKIDLLAPGMMVAVGTLLFVGAMGKSAQIPLYVWLPDAMAGPTPVSALIHAATMVTAGVYMVARFGFLYDRIPEVGEMIAWVGAFSALFAAVIATGQRDIKKILAYSTMSQLGYMFVAAGLGGYGEGLYHVFTHAFFKALLFLGAGSVILALHHQQDIFKMGGLKAKMPLTFWTMLIATLALCGVPPFAGFFSKDAVMLTAFATHHYGLWLITLVTAGLTAYYMTRFMVLVFLAPGEHKSVMPQGGLMAGVLALLAAGSVLAGLGGIPHLLGGGFAVGNWLFPSGSHAVSPAAEIVLILVNLGAVAAGAVPAWKRYRNGAEAPESGWVYHKFYIDEAYHSLFVLPLRKLSRFIADVSDRKIIDGVVRGTASGYKRLGNGLGVLHNGNLRHYAFAMLYGMAAICLYLLWLM